MGAFSLIVVINLLNRYTMGKKKRYIDKTQSVTFHLVDKSHADPTTFDSDNVRVWHTSDAKRREEQEACGMYFDDDYDYMRHLRDRFGAEGEGRGVKSSKSNIFTDGDFPSLAHFDSSLPLLAVENGTDYNAMAADAHEKPGPHWDQDIAVTMDDEFKDFCDDLEDDFVALAGGVNDGREEYEDNFPELGAFDGDYVSDEENREEQYYDENEKCFTRQGGRDSDWKDVLAETEDQVTDLPFEDRQTFLDRQMYLDGKSQKSRFTEYSLTSSAVPRSECQTDLDDHFETMYGEYDDLEVGALDHEEVGGHISINHPSVLRVLGIDDESSTTAKDVAEMRITIEDLSLKDQECASDVDSDDLFPESPPKPEYDCESILSTYSNIYNRPKVIKPEAKVKLDQSGMPKLDKEYPVRLPDPEEDEMDRLKWVPPNVRRREETKEETRARQKIQKEEQRLRRMEKKNNKIAFKMEN